MSPLGFFDLESIVFKVLTYFDSFIIYGAHE